MVADIFVALSGFAVAALEVERQSAALAVRGFSKLSTGPRGQETNGVRVSAIWIARYRVREVRKFRFVLKFCRAAARGVSFAM
jgi:hypothetical protein